MADVKTEQEPSIEEILESIRQIISDDGDTVTKTATPLKPPPAAPAMPPPVPLDLSPPPAKPADNSILDLTEKVDSGMQYQTQPVIELEMMDKPIMDKPMTDNTDALLSAKTAAAATESLSKLVGNVAIEKDEIGRTGNVTLEEMTRDLLRPLLKSWLDQNLPGIIEKIVQKEVEKLSRRAMDR